VLHEPPIALLACPQRVLGLHARGHVHADREEARRPSVAFGQAHVVPLDRALLAASRDDGVDVAARRHTSNGVAEQRTHAREGAPTSGTLNIIVTRAGEEREIEWQNRALHDDAGRLAGVVAIGLDVTDRLRAEQALREQGEELRRSQEQRDAEQRAERTLLRAVVDAFPGFFGLYTADGDFVDANAGSLAKTGRVRGQPVDQKIWDLPQYAATPELRERVRDAVTRAKQEEAVRFEARGPAPMGGDLDVDMSFRPIRDDAGLVTHVGAFGQDVSERNQALAMLRASETRLAQANAKLEQTLASISDGFFTLESRDWTYTYINPAATRLVGRTVEQLTGKRIWEEFPEGIGSAYDLGYRRAAAEGVPLTIFEHYAPLDVWFEANIYPMPGGVSVYFRDVTAQKRAEVALQASEARFRNLMEQASEAIFIADTEAKYLDVNPAACELVGFSREELLRMSAYDLLADPVGQGLDEQMPEIRSGAANRRAWRMRRKDGSVIDVEASIKLLSDGRVVGLTRDVTQQKKVEAALRDREMRLATVFNHTSDAMLLLSVDAGTDLGSAIRVAAANQSFITRIRRLADVEEATLIGLTIDELTVGIYKRPPEVLAEYLGSFAQVIDTRTPITFEHTMVFATGTLFAEVTLVPIVDDGACKYVLWSSHDITARKQAEAEMRASLAEKETLLREIHHRVKNNLQIISSLAHFHMKKVSSPADLTAFAELRERLLAMTLVHERLYQSTDLSRVDLGEYLRSLVAALGRSFELRGGIRVEVDSDDVPLPIEVALPCGMVVCELMTNAFKYAFPGGREGTVALSVRSAEGRVVLGVDDDGVGFPDGFDARAGGAFGWELVRSLVVQLDGSVETTTDRGAHVRVSFATAAEPRNEP